MKSSFLMVKLRIFFKNRLVQRTLDTLLLPMTLLAAVWFRVARFMGLSCLPLTKSALLQVGVFPLVEHYYEPLFQFQQLRCRSHQPRNLPIDWNQEKQLEILRAFEFQEELALLQQGASTSYTFNNGSYSGMDAEYLYSIVRHLNPSCIIEVGSGYSTLMMMEAISKNKVSEPLYEPRLICIEPFEMPWLENLGVELVRSKVEELPLDFFGALHSGDILFIDSSHIIRPQGDVLFEILEVLPSLKAGVYIHFHDIFSPFDYPDRWLKEEFRFWNEQYLLEAFLAGNLNFEIVGGTAYLGHYFPELVRAKFPYSNAHNCAKGGALWLRKLT